jgi:hypothetical protein
MADDQATLGRFSEDEKASEQDDDGATTDAAGDGERTGDEAPETAGDQSEHGGAVTATDESLVCPWCLAPESAFEDGGLTGRRCGRCAATLPVEADWFPRREVVARRPMYDTDA